ncbi:MAG TPA: hypothetical protein VKA36_05885 [Solirubrobacterales bacterium]|nr:hypothetical protein [Solirubrobacterales bacterium]
MQKPHRFLIDRVSSYAEEGAAYVRRRRHRSRSFARVWRDGGAIASFDRDSAAGSGLFEAAEALLADTQQDARSG